MDYDAVDERFELEGLIGSGGMGSVYRARDRQTGEHVALKLLHGSSPEMRARFAREAEILERLDHPAVVGYVAHGEHDGEPYLVMEWVEGEDLRERLRRGPLGVDAAMDLAARVAEALGALHALGVVHRDLNPANLRLVEGEVGVRLLDFGLARHGQSRMTLTGVALGTPAYTAPEQLCGEPNVDARADVFSLGCVLYECLTAVAPFEGTTLAATMAKVMFEEPTPACERRASLPPPLDELLGLLMAKDAEQRPADGSSAAAAIHAVARGLGDARGAACEAEESQAPASALRSTVPPPLSVSEQRLVAVVMLAPDAAVADRTLTPEELRRDRVLVDLVAMAGARVATLPDGTLVGLFADATGAVELAARAARCALELRQAASGRGLALAVGRAVLAARAPVGDVIERATRLLRESTPAGPRLDELAAGLLAELFEINGDAGGLTLCDEKARGETVRTVLGRPTPFVGRTREMRRVLGLLEETREERTCAALLVTGAAGVGKSRLRREFVAALRRAPRSAPQLWFARGHPMAAGSPFWLLAQLLRRLCGLVDAEPAVVRQRKLSARVARNLSGDPQTAAFLGELVEAGFDDATYPALAASRRDPRLMRDQLRGAWLRLLEAECEAAPVAVVLEDLHWGDRPSLLFLDAAMAELSDSALAVVCFARPQVHEQFPRLFKERRFEELRLAPLRPKATARLIAEVLGDGVDGAVVQRIVEQSEGNPLFVEELVRAAAEGRPELPPTVVAMAQARLEHLEPELRRVMRAASVYGRTFWDGALAALLGPDADLSDALLRLAGHELVVRQPTSRFEDHDEYSFRHELHREAAYALLTDEDRARGHRHAGAWLESRGVRDGMLLGGHFEQGGAMARAASWFCHAAERALRGNDLAAALDRAERAIACGAEPRARGRMQLLIAVAQYWRNELQPAEQAAEEAMANLEPGSADWYDAAAELATVRARRGDHAGLRELCERLSGRAPTRDALVALARVAVASFLVGAYGDHDVLLREVDAAAATVENVDDITEAWLLRAQSLAASRNGERARYVELVERSIAAFESVGDVRTACLQTSNAGFGYLQLGAVARATAMLERARARAEESGMHTVAAWCDQNLAVALAWSHHLDRAEQLARASAEAFAESGDGRLEARPRNYLAEILLERGRVADAESEARRAVAASGSHAPSRAFALARLARVQLHGAEATDAYDHACRAHELLAELGGLEDGEMLVRAVYAEATEAALGADRAAPLFAELRALLDRRAAAIEDPVLRASFLDGVPEHARIRSRG